MSQFVLDNLSYIDYNITYRPGVQLVEADAVSRYPCLGPKLLAPEGKIEAIKTLLHVLPTEWQPGKHKMWAYAGKETTAARDLLQTYQESLEEAAPKGLTDHPLQELCSNTSLLPW